MSKGWNKGRPRVPGSGRKPKSFCEKHQIVMVPAYYPDGTFKQNRCRQCHQDRKKAALRRDPRTYMLGAAAARARIRNIPFSLRKEDIVIPDICPVLGIPLFVMDDHVGANSPSLDRVVPELGYVKGNVRVISWRANALKNDASLAELEAVVAYVKSQEIRS